MPLMGYLPGHEKTRCKCPYKTDLNHITQTTSRGGLKLIPDQTGQVEMYLVVETMYVYFTPPTMLKK